MKTWDEKMRRVIRRKAAPRTRRGAARRGRIHDKAYLAWMAQQPCMISGQKATVHHVRRSGEPKDDRRTVPLAPEYHLHDFGPHSIERIGKEKFQEYFNVDLETAIALYNDMYERLDRDEECTCSFSGDQADARGCAAHGRVA